MERPSTRVNVVAGHLAPQATASRFTVVDNTTGKSYEVDAPSGKLSLDIAQDKGTARNHITSRHVTLIGAPFAEGQNLRGCEIAPEAVRGAGLHKMIENLGWTCFDKGNLTLPCSMVTSTSGLSPEWQSKMTAKYKKWVSSGTTQSYGAYSGEKIRDDSAHVHAETKGDPYENVGNAEIIGAACGLVYNAVNEAATQGNFALTIGGDHSIASGTLGGLVAAYPDLCVIWVDAHADANTPDTSPSLHYHGMPAAHVMGWFKKPVAGFAWLKKFLPESRLAYIGLRDIDPEEGRMLVESGCHVFTVADVDRHGIAQVMSLALSKIDPYNNRPVHLTLDIDGIDPVAAPGTGTLARGGLSYREAHYICEELAATKRLIGCDIVEVNPLIDTLTEQMHGDDPDMGVASFTVQLCCELALSALGKTIMPFPGRR